MVILADIATGETQWADIMFLIAVILFVVCAVVCAQARNLALTLVSVGLAATAFGLLLL